MRGEFIRGDGLVIPNNITTYGAEQILKAAFHGVALQLYIGLANCSPKPNLDANELNEPTLGLNGYARQSLSPDLDDWPTMGDLSGETYFETREFVFASGTEAYDAPITRPFLITDSSETEGQIVVAIGTSLLDEITIGPATPLVDRTFKYRIYAR